MDQFSIGACLLTAFTIAIVVYYICNRLHISVDRQQIVKVPEFGYSRMYMNIHRDNLNNITFYETNVFDSIFTVSDVKLGDILIVNDSISNKFYYSTCNDPTRLEWHELTKCVRN